MSVGLSMSYATYMNFETLYENSFVFQAHSKPIKADHQRQVQGAQAVAHLAYYFVKVRCLPVVGRLFILIRG